MKNLINFIGVAEYSVNLHTMKMGLSGEEVMYITVTTLMDGSDYTVVLNGLPMPKQLNKMCGKDVDAAKLIIKTLKEDAVKYAIKYWNFDKDEWTSNLDKVLEQYEESVGNIVVNSNVDTVEGLMDVYTKKGCDVKVGAKKYLNGDYSKNGSEIELYTIDDDWNPKFYIRISSKDGSEITDDIIKSHVKIFYDVTEAK